MYLVAVENYENLIDMKEELLYPTIKTILENNKDKSMNIWIVTDSTRKTEQMYLDFRAYFPEIENTKCRHYPIPQVEVDSSMIRFEVVTSDKDRRKYYGCNVNFLVLAPGVNMNFADILVHRLNRSNIRYDVSGTVFDTTKE